MRHGYFGRKLGRNKDERKQLFRVLSRVMLEKGRIKTTLGKAKAVQPMIEKLITSAKRATSGSLREVQKTLADKAAYERLLVMAKDRFVSRTSGYTRIVKLGARRGDAAEVAYLEFVDAAPVEVTPKAPKGTKVREEAVKVQEAEVVSKEKPKRFATSPKPVRTPRKRS